MDRVAHSKIIEAVAAAIDAESAAGIRWWPGAEMAPIALRRWSSFGRRHQENRVPVDARVVDLAKGLQAHFEPGVPRTPMAEWIDLAKRLGTVLAGSEQSRNAADFTETVAGGSSVTTEVSKRDLVVTRVFSAPVDRVWQAWSDPALVKRWWGPTGFTCPVAKMDFRVGGCSLVCMRAPKELGGQDMYNTWTYEEIVPTKRFVFINRFADKDGNTTDPAAHGLPSGIPKEVRHEIVLEDLGTGNTRLTVTEYDWPVGPMIEMSKMGLEQCLDKMAAIFAGA